MKKLFSVLLCMALLLPALCFSGAAAEAPQPRLYNVYGSGMLFQQGAPALFAGEAPAGSKIEAALYNAAGERVACGEATAGNGAFRVGFPAPEGGYAAYTVTLSANGEPFARLEDVVFGELWLAIGQSNMEYYLSATPEGKEMAAAGETGPADVRVLYVPTPAENGSFVPQYLPQTDVPGCRWFKADDPFVYNMSAAAYFFAVNLQKDLDMPVGVLNAPLGGSAIASWLSRDAINGSETVKAHLAAAGIYYDESRWQSADCSVAWDMTNLYNIKVAPLTNFRPAGAIWYQGCTDLMFGHTNEYYRDLFGLMQESYTADFGYENGAMPFVFSHIACYDYGMGPFAVSRFNEVFTQLSAAAPESRGEVPIYDLSLAYNEMGAIHPMTKKPIGERMRLAAEGLVYGKALPGSAPRLAKSEVKDGSVYLTFENVGDTLAFSGETPRGFAVCGADGVCVEAQAALVAPDTVRVWSEAIPAPAAATYAAGSWSERANLYAAVNGALTIPAAPCGLSNAAITHLRADNAWMNCENDTFFASGRHMDEYVNAWNAKRCSVSVTTAEKTEGDGALRITAQSGTFTLSPNVSHKNKTKYEPYDNVDLNWSDYGTLSLRLKNGGAGTVRLAQVKLYTGAAFRYAPVCAETGLTGVSVPADGAWHTVSFDLSRLLLCGAAGIEKGSEKLEQLVRVEFCFEGAGAQLYMDDIRLLPGAPARTQEPQTGLKGVFAYIRAVFAALAESVRALLGLRDQ